MHVYSIKKFALDEFYEKFSNFSIDRGIQIFLDKSLIKAIIEDLLYISNKTIEGRRIETNFLILNGSEPFRELNIDDYTFIEIANEEMSGIDFSKLKMYFETASNEDEFIVFSPINGRLIFVGLLYLSKKLEYYQHEHYLLDGEEYSKLSHILLNSFIVEIRIDQIIFKIGYDKIAEIYKGNFEIFELPKYFKDIIDRALVLKENKLDPNVINCTKLEVEYFLHQLIISIKNEGHGTIILFGNFDQIEESMAHANYIKTNIQIVDYFSKFCDIVKINTSIDDGMGSDGEMYLESLRDLTTKKRVAIKKSLVGLSKTDGAIIFNKDLKVIGAGVFLRTKTSSDQNIGGSRLRSAEAFIKDHKGTLGIVISQDGNIQYIKS